MGSTPRPRRQVILRQSFSHYLGALFLTLRLAALPRSRFRRNGRAKRMCRIRDIRILCNNRGCLAKRSWALLASNSTRDSQVREGRMCPLGPGCHERSRGRLLRSLGAHSFCPECLENASVRLDPPTDSPEEPYYLRRTSYQPSAAIFGRPAPLF